MNRDIKELKKQLTIRERSDKLRYESINQIFGSLCKSHKEVKRKMNEIESRVSLLECIMGS